MTKFFYKTVLLTVFSLHGLLVFPQTKIIIYNGNTAQKEYKVFTASLINSFANPELECKAEDETKNINYLLKQQGYKKQYESVPDTVIAAVCEKFETDYLINFTLHPQKTVNNVRVSLINAKTLSVEKIKVLTCNDLKNKNQVKIITDEIAVKFLQEEPKEENDTNVVEFESDVVFDVVKVKRVKDGHYLSIGSSLFLVGYYGIFGAGYEYRHRIFGFNASIGFSDAFGDLKGFTVNAGCKIYCANNIPFFKNLYLNLNPVCYFGQAEHYRSSYRRGDNNNIIKTMECKYSHEFGSNFLLGYCPVWKVSEKVSLGFNIDFGLVLSYGWYIFNYSPFAWDLGFVVKLK